MLQKVDAVWEAAVKKTAKQDLQLLCLPILMMLSRFNCDLSFYLGQILFEKVNPMHKEILLF